MLWRQVRITGMNPKNDAATTCQPADAGGRRDRKPARGALQENLGEFAELGGRRDRHFGASLSRISSAIHQDSAGVEQLVRSISRVDRKEVRTGTTGSEDLAGPGE
jgi:hypothetical protein